MDYEMKINEIIEELTLVLIYLTSWDEEGICYDENGNLNKETIKNAWKDYSFDTINELTDKLST